MCGISLSIARNTINVQAFKVFNNIVKHRGPDDEGFIFISENETKVVKAAGADTPIDVWNTTTAYQPEINIDAVNGDYKVAMGHRRLSILDLSPLGHLPMCDKLKRYWITFNGEVYNFVELRAELSVLGYQFSTQSDTEVIIAAYTQWGSECLLRFNGMWAFAIYDTETKKIFIARDRYGIKPLYYWFAPNGDFYMASEIKQFTQIPSWNAQLNPQRVYDYLFYAMTDHTEETMFKNVHSIPPGHALNINIHNCVPHKDGKISSKKWYRPTAKKFIGTFEEACQKWNHHFGVAIDLHLRADVKVGSSLSGGLDSTAIVCSVNKKLKEQGASEMQQTFSSCSHDQRFDERRWIDKVVENTNVEATFIYPEGQDVFSLSKEIIWHQDEPYQSQSAFLSYKVFESARQHNVKVLLNGQGADEYLSGYNAFSVFRKCKMFRKGQFLRLYRELDGTTFLEKVQDLKLVFYQLLPKKLVRYLSRYSTAYKRMRAIIDVEKLGAKEKHPHDKKKFSFNSIFEIAHYQIFFEPLQKYLRWEDRNSMAHSVEARVPFLDHRLVEFSTQLPVDFLNSADEPKKIMKYALTEILPEAIKNRKDKKGFITPEEVWFKKEFTGDFLKMFDQYNKNTNSIIREHEAHKYFNLIIEGKLSFDYTYWRLISLGIWMDVFNIQP